MSEPAEIFQSSNRIKRMRRSGTTRLVLTGAFSMAAFMIGQAAIGAVMAFYTIFSAASLSLAYFPGRSGSRRETLLHNRFLAYVRMIGDVIQVAFIVHITGGVLSPFQMGFALPVVLSSLEERRGRGGLAALLGTLLPSVFEILTRAGLLVDPGSPWGDRAILGPVTILWVSGLIAVCLFALHFITHRLHSSMNAARARALAERDASQISRAVAEEARREIAKLNEFSRQINATNDLHEIIDSIFYYIERRFGADGSIFMLPDREGRTLYAGHKVSTTASRKIQDYSDGIRVPLDGGGIIARAWYRGRPFYVPDTAGRDIFRRPYPGMDKDREFIRELELRSFLLIPMVIRGQTAAMAMFTSYQGPLRLDRPRIDAIARYCEQIAGAVKSAALMRDVERAQITAEGLREESESLNRMLKRIAQLDDIEAIMKVVMEFVGARYGLEHYGLYALNKERQEIDFMSGIFPEWVSPEDRERIRTTPISLSEKGVHAAAYARASLTYFSRVSPKKVDGFERFIVERMKFKFFLVCPLFVQDEIVAFLSFTSYERRQLPKHQREWLSTLGDQIAGVIHSNNLLNKITEERARTETARREIAALAELSRQSMETSDLRTIVDSVHGFVTEHFRIENVVLLLAEDGHLRAREYRLASSRMTTRSELDRFMRTVRVPITDEGGSLARSFLRKKVVHPSRILERWLKNSHYDSLIESAIGFKSFAHVPLVAGGEAIGILGLSSGERIVLRREQIRLLQAMGDQLAGVVRSAAQMEQIQKARAESDRLLGSILPESVAVELKREGRVEPLYYESASVLFTDFVGFTELAAKIRPDELLSRLDGCFSQFDKVVQRNKLERLKTIGDAYMCAGGVPRGNHTHPVDVCLAALEFRSFIARITEVNSAMREDYWKIRIGIHTGPVIAGVIGNYKFSYDIWGDTVNTASRMESSGQPGRVNVSRATFERTEHLFEFEPRGKVSVKGKGEMEMYFLERIKPEFSADEAGLVPNARFEPASMEYP